jgi:hypothetical protein
MKFLFFIPFLIQAAAIAVDEAYFHVRRGLPRWERIGHPVDTASVLICLLFVLFVPYSAYALKWYIALGVISCLLVTKDEWIHKHHCPAEEDWLHALLFLNHPVVLGLVGLFWAPNTYDWLPGLEMRSLFLVLQSAFVLVFLSYQILYWNFLWKKRANS